MDLAAGIHSAEEPVVRLETRGAAERVLMVGGAQIMRGPGAGERGGAPEGGPRERRMSGTQFDTERATRARVGTEARKNKSAGGMRRAV